MKKLLILLLMLLPTAAFANDIKMISDCDGIYHLVLKGDKIKRKIEFVQSENLTTNKEIHKQYSPELTMNTGFFDPKNQKTISYIINNKKIIADPHANPSLMNSKELEPYLDIILNRSELRIVKCKGKYFYQIARHNEPVCKNCQIISSAQGGPAILPNLNLEEEFFILKKEDKIVRESASVLFKTARTVVGIKGGDLHILIITMDNPMNLREVQLLCKRLGFESALNFDGGSSTSLNYKDIDITSTSSDAGRKLKSFMIIK